MNTCQITTHTQIPIWVTYSHYENLSDYNTHTNTNLSHLSHYENLSDYNTHSHQFESPIDIINTYQITTNTHKPIYESPTVTMNTCQITTHTQTNLWVT